MEEWEVDWAQTVEHWPVKIAAIRRRERVARGDLLVLTVDLEFGRFGCGLGETKTCDRRWDGTCPHYAS